MTWRMVGLAALALAVAACATPADRAGQAAAVKPRVIVTTDPELDDANSLLRYLLHSTDFNTEALIYTSSRYHWKGDGQNKRMPSQIAGTPLANVCPCTSWRWAVGERYIDETVEAYAEAYPNLKAHDPRYPTPQSLKSKILWGNVEFEGDMSKETAGSNFIRDALLDDRPGPVYLLAWGGQSTIGRALKSIEAQYRATPEWEAVRAKVSRKAIIQSFGDQDKVNASYIKPVWPEIEFREMATLTYGYGARGAVLPEDRHYLSAAWMHENVSSRGPMGARYFVWGDGKQMVKDDPFDFFGFSGVTADQLKARGYVVWAPLEEKGAWISEGDTSTFMNLLDNGLRGYQSESYGGWGGRGGVDVGPKGPDPHYASARFFGAAQRDLAVRMKWAVTPNFKDANHPPVVSVNGALDRAAKRGERVNLDGAARDPDGDALAYRWWQYADADTYAGKVDLAGAGASTSFVVPADARPGDTIHLIFEVSDNGAPALMRYRRVIVSVAN